MGTWHLPPTEGEVGGQCLILIKRARLIVFGNPVCHGRYAEASLWHRLTYGPACCWPIQGPRTCSPQLDGFPEPRLPEKWGLLLLFSRPPSPPTASLISKSAWAIERGLTIQEAPKEKGSEGGWQEGKGG